MTKVIRSSAQDEPALILEARAGQTGPLMQARDGNGVLSDIVAAGGSIQGAPTYYSFAFAFDDAGLEDGLAVYTPEVADGTVFLLDASLLIDEAFDGTTPKLDIGTGVGVATGLFGLDYPLDLFDADNESAGTGVQIGAGNASYIPLAVCSSSTGRRVGLSPFTALNPLKLWVSQNGGIGGAAVGGAAGAGRLVFGIVTPVVS